jgi:hypothetical protein
VPLEPESGRSLGAMVEKGRSFRVPASPFKASSLESKFMGGSKSELADEDESFREWWEWWSELELERCRPSMWSGSGEGIRANGPGSAPIGGAESFELDLTLVNGACGGPSMNVCWS